MCVFKDVLGSRFPLKIFMLFWLFLNIIFHNFEFLHEVLLVVLLGKVVSEVEHVLLYSREVKELISGELVDLLKVPFVFSQIVFFVSLIMGYGIP